jgi:hypothetical protein
VRSRAPSSVHTGSGEAARYVREVGVAGSDPVTENHLRWI